MSPIIAALKSISSGTFPSQLKRAKVFPIFKGGVKSDPTNYRPISILPTVSKFFEKHVNKHLMNYLNKYKLIHESQSGFRQRHSCQTASVKLIDQGWLVWIRVILSVHYLLTFEKLFDVIDHSILIRKLSMYKIDNKSLQWFISYLQNRQEAVASDQGLSDFAQVEFGVPQGSILGPTFFLLFINDIPLFLNHCHSDFYADDATFHTSSNCLQTIANDIQNDTNISFTWSRENEIFVHFGRTFYMLLGTRQRLISSHQLNISIDNREIKQTSTQKLLGVHIDDRLTWTTHIDHLCSSISSKIFLLKQLSTYVPTEIQKKIYQGYVLPLIDYGP